MEIGNPVNKNVHDLIWDATIKSVRDLVNNSISFSFGKIITDLVWLPLRNSVVNIRNSVITIRNSEIWK